MTDAISIDRVSTCHPMSGRSRLMSVVFKQSNGLFHASARKRLPVSACNGKDFEQSIL